MQVTVHQTRLWAHKDKGTGSSHCFILLVGARWSSLSTENHHHTKTTTTQPVDFPPEIVLTISRLSHPLAIRSLQRACKGFHKLINKDDLVWAEAGWRTHTRDLRHCWHWATRNWHVEVLRAYARDVSVGDREWTLCSEAVVRGDLSVVRFLLSVGVNIHRQEGRALRNAASNGRADVVKELIKDGANVDVRDGDPLHEAASHGHLGVIKVLVDAGVNVHAANEKVLRAAAQSGHVDSVRELLQAGADVHAFNDDALFKACEAGHAAVVTQLVKGGADVHVFEDEPLRRASSIGHLEAVQALLRAGANVHTYDEAALKVAAGRSHIRVLKLLLEEGACISNNTLRTMAEEGRTEVVQAFTEAKANMRASDIPMNESVVHIAATRGHLDVVRVLLDAHLYNGFIVGALLHTATKEGKLELVKMVSALSDGMALDDALTTAAKGGYLEIVKALLAKGVKIRLEPQEETWSYSSQRRGNALAGAATHGHLEVVRTLLEAGADVHAKDHKGNEALTQALRGGHVEVVKTLLNAGATVSAATSELVKSVSKATDILSVADSSRPPSSIRRVETRDWSTSTGGSGRASRWDPMDWSDEMSVPERGSERGMEEERR
ncbi:hypothetical protein HDV00_001275 [Rhizophlyctis rosea]|nr:hypothetical protein HDV00_001275 [Rhizophlyctis rosea]